MNNLEFEIIDHGYFPTVITDRQVFLIPQNMMIEVFYDPSLFNFWRVDKAKRLVRKLIFYGKNKSDKKGRQKAY